MVKEDIQATQVKAVDIVATHTHGEIAQHMEINAKSVAKTITLKLCVKVEHLINAIQADPDPRKRVRA